MLQKPIELALNARLHSLAALTATFSAVASIATFNNDPQPPPKWSFREFDVSRIWSRLDGFPYLETFTWQNSTPAGRVPGLADWAARLGGSPHLSYKRDQIQMVDYIDRRVTPLKRVTPPTWGPSPPCKQALRFKLQIPLSIFIGMLAPKWGRGPHRLARFPSLDPCITPGYWA